eukprot:g37329.t1
MTVSKFCSNCIYKFADNTTVLGQISHNDEMEYRKEIECLMAWCKENNLSINVSKMKELLQEPEWKAHSCLHQCAEVELVKCIKFPGVTITNKLSWSIHVDTSVKKVQQYLYFLRRLRKFPTISKEI